MSEHAHAFTPSPARERSRRLVISRAPDPSDVQRRLEFDRRGYTTGGMVDPDRFATELASEFARRRKNGRDCAVASISIFEVPGLVHRFGPGYVFDLITEYTRLLIERLRPGDVFHVAENGDVLLLGRDSSVGSTVKLVEHVVMEVARRRWDPDGEALLFTPSAGLATLDDGDDPLTVLRRAIDAREVAAGHLDLRVNRWEPAMSVDTAPVAPARATVRSPGRCRPRASGATSRPPRSWRTTSASICDATDTTSRRSVPSPPPRSSRPTSSPTACGTSSPRRCPPGRRETRSERPNAALVVQLAVPVEPRRVRRDERRSGDLRGRREPEARTVARGAADAGGTAPTPSPKSHAPPHGPLPPGLGRAFGHRSR